MLLSNPAGINNRREHASESSAGRSGASEGLNVSVIVPTRNEAGNVAELIRRVDAALGGQRAEIIIVDDSDDDTPVVAMQAAEFASLRVRVMHRDGRSEPAASARRCSRASRRAIRPGSS